MAVGIDDDVVGQRFLARQIVFGDDHVGGAALRPRQPLEIECLAVGIAHVGVDQEPGGGVHQVGGHARPLAARTAGEQKLRACRHALGRVAAHPREHLLPFVGRVDRGEHALQRMAADAVRQERLDLVVARRARQPLGIGELRVDVLGLGELEVGRCGGAAGDIDLLRADEIISGRADGDVVVPGLDPVRREAELALVVRHHRRGDGRALLLGADEDAFHRAFLGRGDLAAERRLRIGAGHHQAGQYARHARIQEGLVDSHEWFSPGMKLPTLVFCAASATADACPDRCEKELAESGMLTVFIAKFPCPGKALGKATVGMLC